jgi:hypothetical protein
VVTLTSTTPVSDIYLLYSNGSSGFPLNPTAVSLGDAPTGVLTTSVTLSEPADLFEFEYTIIGVYSDPTNPDADEQMGVSMTFDANDVAFILGDEYEDVFPEGPTESEVITALQTDDTSVLLDLFEQNFFFGLFPDAYNEAGTQVNFSTADISGSAFVGVPEPASIGLVLAGVGVMCARRRRHA